jgi:hypothetical protein
MASAVFLGVSPTGLISNIFLSFIERRKSCAGSERHYGRGGGREINICGLQDAQSVPASPSGKGKAYMIRIHSEFVFMALDELHSSEI